MPNVPTRALLKAEPLKVASVSLFAGVRLPDVGFLAPQGLTVIVGPNSSGKTLLLKEIRDRLIGEPRPLIVACDVLVKKPSHVKRFVDNLVEAGFADIQVDDQGNPVFAPNTPRLGTSQQIGPVPVQNIDVYYERCKIYEGVDAPPKNANREFLGYFGPLLMTSLFRSVPTPSARTRHWSIHRSRGGQEQHGGICCHPQQSRASRNC
jgi:hypothetical protein